jgi:transaldolase
METPIPLRPLERMAATTPTAYWNDSCAVDELADAIAHGAVGATTNPPIVLEVLKKDPDHWAARARELYAEHPTASEADLTWWIIEELAVRGAALLVPAFERSGGAVGRLSLQTNPKLYRDAAAIVTQAEHFATLAPNLQVKVPATAAGIAAIEEATWRGLQINATVSFTVAQALAVAEAVERGLARRAEAGRDVAGLHPVCTIMVGRIDDWLKLVCERDDVIIDPDALEWAGVAVMKRAYQLFCERGYRTRLLVAAYRSHLHWSTFVGGDVILTIPHRWQRRFNGSAVEVRPQMDEPVDPGNIAELSRRLPDFRRAYEPDGLAIAEFDTYGATVRTLRQFIRAYDDLESLIRDYVLPDPGRRA